MAMFLTTSVVGQSGIIRCLCTGEMSWSADVTGECSQCEVDPCGDCPDEVPDGKPSPCEKDDCFVVVSLSVVDIPATLTLESVFPVALPEAFAAAAPLPASLDSSAADLPIDHPPPRHPIALTILYGSFLI